VRLWIKGQLPLRKKGNAEGASGTTYKGAGEEGKSAKDPNEKRKLMACPGKRKTNPYPR